MNYVIVAVALVILVLLCTKIKSLIFKAKDATLIKEDERLVQVQAKQEQKVSEAKKEIEALKTEELPPEMVEDFWKNRKK